MGYRGKLYERQEARRLRALGWTMPDIAAALGVSRSSVSLWTRNVPVEMGPCRRLRPREPNVLERRKAAEIAELLEAGRVRIGRLSERDLLIAGTALYAGEGSKTDGMVCFANSDPAMVALFCTWLRTFFTIDESRLRVRIYLHQGLDMEAATSHWSNVTGVLPRQFHVPYRANPRRIDQVEQASIWLRVRPLLVCEDSSSHPGPRARAANLASSVRGGAIGSAAPC